MGQPLLVSCLVATFLVTAGVATAAGAADAQAGQTPPQAQEPPKTLQELVARMGREPDRSHDGGACGGIIVHEWHREGRKAISLGASLQWISEPKHKQSVTETSNE